MSKIFRSTNSSQLSAAPVNGLSQEDTSPGLREREPQPRELAHRSNDGLEVTLFWRAGRDEGPSAGPTAGQESASRSARSATWRSTSTTTRTATSSPSDISYEDTAAPPDP